MNTPSLSPDALNPQALELRDIHLPEPISWWPLAPGWWMLLASAILLVVVIIISRKVYQSRQLKRDIKTELETVKNQFQQSQNKSQLAKSLSALLRRASISYFPSANTAESYIAGLTGEQWLSWLDETHNATRHQFQSETGRVLLNAPYLPENSKLEYDADKLLHLSESWLLATHKKTQLKKVSNHKTQRAVAS